MRVTGKRRSLTLERLEPRWVLSGSVVFNEVMYNPAGETDETLEWLELHNQMAVDMDVSAWTLADGVEFEFPASTIIPGGGHLVVAADPAALQAATGFAGALGPFTGRLSNGGERLALVNHDDRIVDAVEYGDEGDWPVGPDASGASLAKLDPDSASEFAESWCTSAQVGGTPGQANFDGSASIAISLNEIAGAQEAEFSVELANHGDTGLPLAGYRLVRSGDVASPFILPAETLAAGAFRTFTAEELGPAFRPLSGERLFFFTPGENAVVDAEIVEVGRRGRLPDGTGPWLYPDQPTPDGPNSFDLRDEIVINEIMYHYQPTAPSPAVVEQTTAIAIDGTWKYDESGIDLSTPWRDPQYDDGDWSSGDALFHAGVSVSSYALTVLSDDPEGYWRLDETSGGTAYDASGNERHADYVGGVTKESSAAEAIDGSSVSFDGSSGYVQLPDTWGGTNVHSMTVEAWVNTDGPITGDFQAVVSSTGTSGFGHFQLHDAGQTGPYTNAGARFVTPPTATPTGVWRHIVFVCQSGDTRVYVDGVRLGAANLDSFDYIGPHSDVRIANGYAFGRWFHGQIDEVAIYYHALDDETVLEHYQVGSGELSSLLQTPLSLGPTTYYLRKEFEFPGDPASTELTIDPMVDDGAVYYLNGAEVHRQNMPAGEIAYDTLASAPIEGNWSGDSFTFPGSQLIQGTNVLAVEVHQAAVGDTDVLFGAKLYAVETVSPAVQFSECPEEWVELYNRAAEPVDLAGWKLAGGIDFEFTAGTTIAPGEYLVVAGDMEALSEKHPTIDVVGDYSGRLGNADDLIVLQDPHGNPADEVYYFDDGRWSEYADGGGSSLELRDPAADNSRAEAWAASDEASRSLWNDYSYRGIAVADIGPTNFNEFILGMLNDGEILLDDIRVVEDPDGAARELIQNGTFESGTTEKWRTLGNHSQSSVTVDPDDPENMVLHLVSTGTTEHLSNHAETTLKYGSSYVAVSNGTEYEISFRAKWLAGSRQLRSNFYFNRLAKTTVLAAPSVHGTPGMQNSCFETNIGPTYRDLHHEPVVPNAYQNVTVSVMAEDPHDVDLMTLWYSAAGAAFTSVAMVDQGNGRYTGSIPGRAAATVVQFYVQGTDSQEATSTFPAAGPDSHALYRVQDGQARLGSVHNFRIIMTTADANWLHTNTNLMSNEWLGGTVVYDESRAFYDVGVRLKGTTYGRPYDQFVSYFVRFQPDNLFRGVYESVAVDRSARGPVGSPNVDEILIKQVANHAGGINSVYDDIIRVIAPKSQHTSIAQLQLDRYRGVYLDSQFDNGSDYPVHEFDGAYYLTRTTDGNPESLKVVQYGPISYTDIRDLGDDKELYRLNWTIKNKRAADEYDHIIELNKTFSLTGTELDETIGDVIDLDQWFRHYALLSLTGVSDTYTHGNPHNLRVYERPEDGLIIGLLQDMDTSFRRSTASPLWGSSNWNLVKIIERPQNRRIFMGHLLDLINTTYNTSYMSYWTNHYGSLAGSNFSGILSYIGSRASYVLSQLPGQIPFRITTNGGSDFSVDDVSITIQGDGWINVREIYLNGQSDPLEVTWLDTDTWQITLPLEYGPNTFDFQAYDYRGNLVGNDQITVTSTVLDRPLQQFLRITELNYHPSNPTAEEQSQGFTDDNDFEFIELTNIGNQALDMTGVTFSSGIDFEFTGDYSGPQILITEAGTGTPDYFEVQNVSGDTVDTSGWVVAANNARYYSINDVHSPLWAFPDFMAADEVRYRPDTTDDNIFWRTEEDGWLMIVDDEGNVVDFVVWGYSSEDVASMLVDVNGFAGITVEGAWSEAPVVAGGLPLNSLQRIGSSDHDDASDWTFTTPRSEGVQNADLTVPFASEVGLAPGEFVVLAYNAAAFEVRYGTGVELAGTYDGRLNNGGEQITLLGPAGQVLFDFEYGDSNDDGWPNRADGNGSSLELIDPAAVPLTGAERIEFLGNGANWRSSINFLGSPGRAGDDLDASVVVNEVLSHTDYPLVDAIELCNTTAEAIDVGGWWLSDSSDDLEKFQIPAGTTIPGYGYLVFAEGHYVDQGGQWVLQFDQTNEFGGSGEKDFALSGAEGDDVWLLKGTPGGRATHFVNHVEFGAALSGESFGRWPDAQGDLYPMTSRTLDPAGPNSGPRIGPELIITEVMYHPPDPDGEGGIDPEDLEFIEIYNTTSYPVDLTDWRLRKDIDIDFAESATLAPHTALVVAPFDPNNTSRLADFRGAYSIDASVRIVGGYDGRLSDEGGLVQLQDHDEPTEVGDPPQWITPHPLEDEVNYEASWYPTTAGNGHSLNRLGSNDWGNDPASWTAGAPTPGSVELAARIDGRYIFYNNSSFGTGPGKTDTDAIAPDKQALLPGSVATFANYTSYALGINGIILDVFDLKDPAGLSATDFTFKVGNDDSPASWTSLTTMPTVDVRADEGSGGSDRVVLTWADNVIQNHWLEVTMKANGTTGLAAPDVFYFGNAIGETGDTTTHARVDSTDVLHTRNNPHPFFDAAQINSNYDFDRDGRVNATDIVVARNNQTTYFDELNLIDLSESKTSRTPTRPDTTEKAPADGRTSAHDAVLERTVPREWNRPIHPRSRMDWVWQLDSVGARDRPAKSIEPAERAVDLLLATGQA